MDNLGSPEPALVVAQWKECLESLHLESANKRGKCKVSHQIEISISTLCSATKKMKIVGGGLKMDSISQLFSLIKQGPVRKQS